MAVIRMSDNHIPKEKIVVSSGGWISETEPRNKFTIPMVMLLLCVLFFFLGSWYHSKTDPDYSSEMAQSEKEKAILFKEKIKEKRRADSASAASEVHYEAAVYWKDQAQKSKVERKQINEHTKKRMAAIDSISYDSLIQWLRARYGLRSEVPAHKDE